MFFVGVFMGAVSWWVCGGSSRLRLQLHREVLSHSSDAEGALQPF